MGTGPVSRGQNGHSKEASCMGLISLGPIHSNCTDTGLLALLLRAQVNLLTLLPMYPHPP